MYKSLNAIEFKKRLDLPLDYKVKGFISYGGWGNEKHFNFTRESLNSLHIKYTDRQMDGFLSDILEIKINNNIYWSAVVYAGAKLSEYLHLACLFGSEKNIHIGGCGGLYPKINSLDLVIPLWSYGTESSASMYDRENVTHKYYANEKLSTKIKMNMNKKYKIWKGPIVSCHAMLGETIDDIRSWSKQGYYAVEMETATMFAVSKHFNVPSASILFVSDNLIKGQTANDKSHVEQKDERNKVKMDTYKIAIETILN